MTVPYTDIYNKLQATQHRTDNGVRYWMFSDLNDLYQICDGTPNDQQWHVYNAFKNNPTVKKLTTGHNGHAPKMDDLYHGHIVTIKSDAGDEPTDMKLSRFAAWTTIANHNAWGVLFGRTYMLHPDDNFYELLKRTDEYSRLILRERLGHTRRIVNGILYSDGGNFSEFNALIHSAFYNYMDADTLKHINHLPIKRDDPLSNYMGPKSLMARNAALRSAIDEFNRIPHKPSIQTFFNIAGKKLHDARMTLKNNYNVLPETDLCHTSIQQVQTKLNQAVRDFTKYYATRTLDNVR